MPLVVRNAVIYKVVHLIFSLVVLLLTFIPSESAGVENVFCVNARGNDCFPAMIYPFLVSSIATLFTIGILLALLSGRRRRPATAEYWCPLLMGTIWYSCSMVIFFVVVDEWDASEVFKRDFFPWTWKTMSILCFFLMCFSFCEANAMFAYPGQYYRVRMARPFGQQSKSKPKPETKTQK